MVSFPKEGYCESINEELINYFNKRATKYENLSNFLTSRKPVGVAWNENGSWYVYGSSQKPKYKIEKLLTIINNQNEIIEVW